MRYDKRLDQGCVEIRVVETYEDLVGLIGGRERNKKRRLARRKQERSKDSPDPAAEMQEQLEYFTKGIRLKEPKSPTSKRLLDKPGVEVWHRRTDRRVVVRMEIETGDEWSMTRQLFNLTQEVTKCFAINQKSLSARQ